jgi:hypothetical protein
MRSRVAAVAALALAGVLIGTPAAAAEACPVADATLTWGFKESFRSYISGTIANGEWTVADGATYETPVFSWSGGSGDYDGSSGAGEVSFDGSIEFTGHGGILDTTIAHPRIRFVDGGRAILVVDVTGTTQAGDPVDATDVEFVTLDLAGSATLDGDTLRLTDTPATLTAAGAAAFGTYPAGEAFDTVTAALPLESSCAALAPVPPPAWPFWVAGGVAAAALLAAAAAVVLVLRRRRRAG